jgi:hypothetical protein
MKKSKKYIYDPVTKKMVEKPKEEKPQVTFVKVKGVFGR